MAGYVFGLNNIDSLRYCIENGIYSTNLSNPSNNLWRIHQEGTFADYVTMKEGDNIYFFIDRKIYGIGKLVNIKGDCKFNNFPNASIPTNPVFKDIRKDMLLNDYDDNINNRWVCLFEPNPNFFTIGIDMDDVLASNPRSFRSLRAFWKLSFIKIDDEENKALKDIILKRNEEYINSNDANCIFDFNKSLHNEFLSKLDNRYNLTSKDILQSCSSIDKIKHEMAIEAGLLYELSTNLNTLFGRWDYLSHQVVASPFKPIDYMDKMDIFGYRYIQGFDTISKYLLIELKKDSASIDSIDQIMKYVDWINQEYAYGDYSMIKAFVVAYDFSQDVVNYRNKICIRNFTKGRRPNIPAQWTDVKLVKYSFDSVNKNLNFIEIN